MFIFPAALLVMKCLGYLPLTWFWTIFWILITSLGGNSIELRKK